MQTDIEVAFALSDQILAAGSVGYYSLELPLDPWVDKAPEYRRQYLLLRPNPAFTIRAGRFFPGYGLMIADHTANIRQGLFWPQGGESTNVEIGWYNQGGEVITSYSAKDDKLGRPSAGVLRASLYLGKTNQLGLSLYYDEEKSYSGGFFAIVGALNPVFYMGEVDAKGSEGKPSIFVYQKLGLEVYKGLFVLLTRQDTFKDEGRTTKGSGGLQVFPFPHFETLLSIESYESGGEVSTGYSILGHYYL